MRSDADLVDDPTGPAARMLDAGVDVVVAGTTLRLLAARAAWWPQGATLFVADVHLGKAETFRSLGVPVPTGPTAATLARLAAVVDGCAAKRLVVLGDLLHARQAHAAETLAPLRAWRAARPALACVLVRGNHDDRAGDPPPDLGFEVVDAPAPLGPFALCHEPADTGGHAPETAGLRRGVARSPLDAAEVPGAAAVMQRAVDAPRACTATDATDATATPRAAPTPHAAATPNAASYRLAGHLHPAVRLHGRAGDAARLPCFVVGDDGMVLPAFGDFTGAATVSRAGAGRLYAIAGDRVFALPRSDGGR
jgi:DNA ligase-associated metallophosphoesterase